MCGKGTGTGEYTRPDPNAGYLRCRANPGANPDPDACTDSHPHARQ